MDEIQKHAGGAPTKYRPAMIDKVKEYLQTCEHEKALPSIVGLSVVLGVARRSLEGWKVLSHKDLDEKKYPMFEEFLHMLRRVSDAQLIALLQNGLNQTWNSTIVKLVLAKHGYHDKVEQVGQGSPTVHISLGAPVVAREVISEVVKELKDE